MRLVPLTPPIDTLHTYPGLPAPLASSGVALVVRQMIAQQVMLEGIRRAEAVRGSPWLKYCTAWATAAVLLAYS